VWSGTIAISLITLPVQLYPATEERRIALREVHDSDGGRVRHRRWCEAESREIPYAEIGRAYETPDGTLVPLSDAELEQLPLPTRRTCTVLGFAPADVLDPLQLGRPYWAAPHGQAAARPYALMTEALFRADRIGLGRLAIRSRERLAAIVPRDGVLLVHTLRWPDEVRSSADLAPTVPLDERELDLARTLIEQLTDVDLAQQHDEYRHALEALVDAKLAGRAIEAPRQPAPAAVDLMATLEAAVRQAREERE
jgi:DNA end-binding protein Ku